MLNNISVNPEHVDTICISGFCTQSLNEQSLLSGLLANNTIFADKMIDTAENACSSGGQAIFNIIARLKSGIADVGMAVGIEKMRGPTGKMDGKLIGKILGSASYPDEREGKVFVFPHLFAEIMEKYIKYHNSSEEELAHIPALFYSNANKNPLAQMHKVKITLEDVMKIEGFNRYVIEGLPLKTFDCSQITDGYASVLLCNEKGLEKLSIEPDKVVEITGFAQSTAPLFTELHKDILRPQGAYNAVQKAYKMAGVTPNNISVAEVHDCFSVMGAMSAEIIGKAEFGQGAKYYVDNRASVDGECAINTSGGLMAKGHPIGATGVAMVGWMYNQMTGSVPSSLQVKNIDHGVTFNIGGPICASVVFVLRNKD